MGQGTWGAVNNPTMKYAVEPNSIYNPTTNLQMPQGANPIQASPMGGASAAQSPFMKSMLGGSEQDKFGNKSSTGGWLSPLTSAIGTGVNAYMGMKGLGLAEESLDFQKDSWEKNFAMMQDQYYRKLNSKRSINATYGMDNIEDRRNVWNHYDSGTNLEGAYRPGPTVAAGQANSALQAGAATPEMAAQMMGKTGMYNNGGVAGANTSGFTAPMASEPQTASSAAIRNTNVGPDGKRRVKKKDDVGSRTVDDDAQ